MKQKCLKLIGLLVLVLAIFSCDDTGSHQGEFSSIGEVNKSIIESGGDQCKDILGLEITEYYSKHTESEIDVHTKYALTDWMCRKEFSEVSSDKGFKLAFGSLDIGFSNDDFNNWKMEHCSQLNINNEYDSSQYNLMDLINQTPNVELGQQVIEAWRSCMNDHNYGLSCWVDDSAGEDFIKFSLNYTAAAEHNFGNMDTIDGFYYNLENMMGFPRDVLQTGNDDYIFQRIDKTKYSTVLYKGENGYNPEGRNIVTCSVTIPPYCNPNTIGKSDSCQKCNPNSFGEEDSCSDKYTAVPLYRYYSPGNTDHFYTTDLNPDFYASVGYYYQDIQGYVFNEQIPGTVPLNRFTTADNKHNFLTISNDFGLLSGHGIYFQGVTGWVYSEAREGTVPLNRYYDGKSCHFYTISTDWQTLSQYGLYYQDVQGYLFPQSKEVIVSRNR